MIRADLRRARLCDALDACAALEDRAQRAAAMFAAFTLRAVVLDGMAARARATRAEGFARLASAAREAGAAAWAAQGCAPRGDTFGDAAP